MFWKFDLHTSSHLEALLEKEDVTLAELMEEEDVLQECKAQNRRLLLFLSQDHCMQELLRLITTEPPAGLEETQRFKHPNIACELLTSDVGVINDKLGSEEPLLEILYAFLEQPPPLNPLLASFFSKTIGNLITRKTEQVIWFLRGREGFLSLVLKHIDASAMMDLLLRLISCVEPSSLRQDTLNWLNEEKLAQRLIDLIHPGKDDERQSNASQTLCDIIRLSRDQANQLQENSEADPLLTVLESQECVGQLLRNMFEGEKSESCIVNGTQVLLTLLEIRRPMVEGLMDLCVQGYERCHTVNSSILLAIQPHLTHFHQLLLDPPKRSPMLTTLGVLEVPLGNSRLHVARLVAALLQSSSPSNTSITQEICRLNTINLLLDLFFKYTWNNFLHFQVELCVAAILSHSGPEERPQQGHFGPEERPRQGHFGPEGRPQQGHFGPEGGPQQGHFGPEERPQQGHFGPEERPQQGHFGPEGRPQQGHFGPEERPQQGHFGPEERPQQGHFGPEERPQQGLAAQEMPRLQQEPQQASSGPGPGPDPDPKPSEPTAAPHSVASHHTLVAHLFQHCRLVQRILEAWEENDKIQAEGGMRRGYMGHLTRIANTVVQNLEKGPVQTQINSLITELPEDCRGRWESFVDQTLTETNRKNTIDLVSTHNLHSSSEDDDMESPFPNEMTLQQAFSDYQIQQMTANFVDQFGFNDEEFAEHDDSINATFDRITEINFSVDTEGSANTAVFEACAKERIQPFNDNEEEEDIWEEKEINYATHAKSRTRFGGSQASVGSSKSDGGSKTPDRTPGSDTEAPGRTVHSDTAKGEEPKEVTGQTELSKSMNKTTEPAPSIGWTADFGEVNSKAPAAGVSISPWGSSAPQPIVMETEGKGWAKFTDFQPFCCSETGPRCSSPVDSEISGSDRTKPSQDRNPCVWSVCVARKAPLVASDSSSSGGSDSEDEEEKTESLTMETVTTETITTVAGRETIRLTMDAKHERAVFTSEADTVPIDGLTIKDKEKNKEKGKEKEKEKETEEKGKSGDPLNATTTPTDRPATVTREKPPSANGPA